MYKVTTKRLGVGAAGFALLALLAAGCGKDSGGGTSTAPVAHGCNILPSAGDVLDRKSVV